MAVINLTNTADVTLKTAGKYCEDDIQIVQNLEEVSATPTDSVQEFIPSDGKNGISKFIVNKTPTEQVSVKSTEQAKIISPSSGKFIDEVNVEPVALQSKTITPTKATQTISADAGYDGLKTMTIEPIPDEYIIPSGSIDIVENGTYNVTDKSGVNVNIPTGGDDVFGKMLQGIWVDYVDTQGSVTAVQSYAMMGTNQYLNSIELPKCSYIGYSAFKQTGISLAATGITPAYFRGLRQVSLAECVDIRRDAFLSCFNLETIYAPGLKTIGESAFAICRDLRSLSFPELQSIGAYGFDNCINMASLYAPNVSFIGSNAFRSCSKILEYSFPSLTQISISTFTTNTQLVSFYAPNLSQLANYALYGCTNLTNITIDYDNLQTIPSYAFKSCTALPSFNAPNCTTIGSEAFNLCTSLSIISFPNCTTIGTGAFESCTSLSTVSFPNLTSLSYRAFSACGLEGIDLPKCTWVGTNAFQSCSKLSTASLPLVTTLGSSAFQGCTSLVNMSLPMCSVIQSSTFQGCFSLMSIDLPKCERLEFSAFANCYNLSWVNLPIVSSFRTGAFINCSRLATVILLSTSIVTMQHSSVFFNTPMKSSGYLGYFGSIYVPADLVDSYKTATNWTYFADRITSIDNLPTT